LTLRSRRRKTEPVTRLLAHRPADSTRLVCEPRVAREADHLYGLVSTLGNRAATRLLQRCTVDPMPIIYRQFLMWRQEAKVLDLNCGWYSQLAAVDHFYIKNIRGRLTAEQQRQLEGAATPHLSYESGRALLPYSNMTVFTDFGFDPSGAETAAIATSLDKPDADDPATRREEWKALLRAHGPLIVGGPFGEPFGVAHYVTVVEVKGDQMRYLDALTFGFSGDRGTMRSQSFAKMSGAVTSIDYIDPSKVEAMFSTYIAQASTSSSSTSSSMASKA
jgi:hypothetical protein